MKYADHRHNTEIEMAAALILFGNISEINTQVTGANDIAYVPIAASKNHDTHKAANYCFSVYG